MKTLLTITITLLSTSSFAWLNSCPCLPDPAADTAAIYRNMSVEIQYTEDDTIAKSVIKRNNTLEVK